MNYRFDKRTKQQFKRDIKKSTKKETGLMERWLAHVATKDGKRPKAKRVSAKGANGEFLENHEVVIDADFEVEGYGLIEVKFAKPMLTGFFHLKIDQVEKYIKIGAAVLMINGADSGAPEFSLIKPRRLRELLRECERVSWGGFGGKESIRIPVKRVRWEKLS